MGNLNRRLLALEAGDGADLTPHAKAWLGLALTDAEQRVAALPANIGDIDTRRYSRELKAWLGID